MGSLQNLCKIPYVSVKPITVHVTCGLCKSSGVSKIFVKEIASRHQNEYNIYYRMNIQTYTETLWQKRKSLPLGVLVLLKF